MESITAWAACEIRTSSKRSFVDQLSCSTGLELVESCTDGVAEPGPIDECCGLSSSDKGDAQDEARVNTFFFLALVPALGLF